jgi:HAD superfamily hydrolase (TIGR01450 family)
MVIFLTLAFRILLLASPFHPKRLDMWGVMHDGIKPYEGVLEVVQQLKIAEKELVILSNSSKRQDNSIKMLIKLGFNPSDFSEIITSGEVANHLLQYLSSSSLNENGGGLWIPSKIPKPFLDVAACKSSRHVFCFGSGDGDEEYLTSCGWKMANSIENADLIVARGTFVILDKTACIDKKVDGEEVYFQAYYQALEKAAEKRIPMMVCNPDKIRPDADRSPMPGMIGVTYEQMLEKNGVVGSDISSLVLYLGKPFVDIYDMAMRDFPGKRTVMVGDAIETDIAGASAAGIDSIWVVKNGIHGEAIEALAVATETDESDDLICLEKSCSAVLGDFNRILETTYAKGRQISPTIILPRFQW